MKNVLRWLLLCGLCCLALGLVVGGYLAGWFDGWLAQAKEPGTVAKAERSGALRVETVLPALRTTVQPARVEPLERIELVPKITGYLESLGTDIDGKVIDTGSHVKAGTVLATISVPELEKESQLKQAAVKEAEGAVQAAHKRLNQAQKELGKFQAEMAYWEEELPRYEELFRSKSIEKSLLDGKRNLQKAAKSALESADERVAQGQADLIVAESKKETAGVDAARLAELLKYTKVQIAPSPSHAPGAGTSPKPLESLYLVTRRWADPGAYLQPGAGPQRAALMSLARVDRMKVVVDVPEVDSARVAVGDRAMFTTPALPGQRFEGQVSRFAGSLEPPARTMRVEIDLPNPNGRPLYAEMFGSVTLFLGEREGVLVVPSQALRREGDKAYLFCVADGKLTKTLVQTGMDDGIQVEITSGLRRDQRVVRVATPALSEGLAVAIAEEKK
jgi:multidrug efflux pump subunit AcrA (membrane-fusion protein)